jgi:hypothetical protein
VYQTGVERPNSHLARTGALCRIVDMYFRELTFHEVG